MSKVFTITEGLENMGAIRTGGQGSVYKGRRVGEIITAIKLLPTPVFIQDESDKHYRDFSNEVKKLQRVNEEPNPNVVKIVGSGISETGGFPFIEMEFIDGPDLGELIRPPHLPVFTIKEVLKVADHLSHALAHCHRLDVKHGDIKSNNVKYNKHTGNYVLLDFGLAILSNEDRRTSLRQAGAIEFMAPEQNEGRMYFETDVYSFGIVLYELLAGKVPFPLDGNSQTARNKVMVAHMEATPPDLLSLRASMLPTDWPEAEKNREMQVPEWLVKLVYKCLAKKPEDRFRNGVELHDFISSHRVYTPEVAGIVKHEDDRWQSVMAEKEYEVQDLKAIIARQDKELELMRQKAFQSKPPLPEKRPEKTVSKAAFNALLVTLFVVGALAVYGLFFSRPVVESATTDNNVFTVDDSLRSENQHSAETTENGKGENENNKAAERTSEKNTSGSKKPPVVNSAGGDTTTGDDTSPDFASDEKKANEKVSASGTNAAAGGKQYRVRDKAYFHNNPDAGSKRDAFIIHWNNAVLTPLADQNGFVYIVFTNHLGQTSKGWLSKADLEEIK